MELETLRAFVTLARMRRFTSAARSLGVSQPSLSRQVQRLERDVGAALVVRSSEGASLTEAGARFHVHAERALASLQAGVSEVDDLGSDPKGTVVLGTLATVSTYVLPDVISTFHKKHPAVRLRVREGFRDELEGLVARGAMDLAILQLPARREGLTVVTLWHEDYVLAVPPGHRLANSSKPIALEDVASEPFVLIPGGTTAMAIEAACAARGVVPDVVLETDNVETVRRMVQAGLGLAIVPRIMARDPSRWSAKLRPLRHGSVRRGVALVHRGPSYLTAAARALRDEIVREAKRVAHGAP